MTDREKLIELMNENFTEYCNVDIVAGHCKIRAITFDVDRFADFLISNGVTVQKWIPVSERLPEERDSIFKRFHGTKLWQDGMFLTVSNTVLASVLNEDGTRTVKAMHTQGGEWNLDSMPWAKCVTHWMPLPEPPKEDV